MTVPGQPYQIRFSKAAAANLQTISDRISKDSPDNAARMVAKILKAIDLLEIFPHRTVAEDDNPKLKHPSRILPVDPYLVYFRVLDDHRVVRITRIRHGARRRPNQFD